MHVIASTWVWDMQVPITPGPLVSLEFDPRKRTYVVISHHPGIGKSVEVTTQVRSEAVDVYTTQLFNALKAYAP